MKNIMDLNQAEVAVTTQHLIDMGQKKDNLLQMSDFGDMGEFLCTCSELFPEEETPEAVLIRQLEEYKLFKEIVTELKEQENVDRFYRDPDKNVGKEVSVIKENLSLDGFIAAFNKFLAKLQVKSQQSTTVSRTMARESFSVPQKINFIREVLKTVNEFKFAELFEPGASRNEYVTTFIAVLELTKLQIITIRQSDIFEDIVIVKREGSDDIHVDVEGEYEQVE